MTSILLIMAAGLSLLLAGRWLQRRTEITALASVKSLAKKSTNRSKEKF
jgi:hypothetical protein